MRKKLIFVTGQVDKRMNSSTKANPVQQCYAYQSSAPALRPYRWLKHQCFEPTAWGPFVMCTWVIFKQETKCLLARFLKVCWMAYHRCPHPPHSWTLASHRLKFVKYYAIMILIIPCNFWLGICAFHAILIDGKILKMSWPFKIWRLQFPSPEFKWTKQQKIIWKTN